MVRSRRSKRDELPEVILEEQSSLLDLLDNVLNKGVVVTGDLMLGVAGVDLVYVRVAALLCAADRILYPSLFEKKPKSDK